MTWPPPQGGNPDPYGQDPYNQDPYRQQQPPPQDTPPPGYDPNAPYGTPTSGQPYSPNPGYQQYGAAPPPYQSAPPPYQSAPPPYQAAYPPPPAPSTNIMAILSLVFAFVFAPVGIVLGHIAKKQLKTSGEQGGGLATAGLVCSYIFTSLGALACCGWLAAIIFASTTTSSTTY